MFVFLLGSFLTIVLSFSNGTLLPYYLCGENDGLPKSLGGVLPYLILGTSNDPYDQFPGGINPVIVPSAAQILGSFHGGNPAMNYTTPTENIITIVPTDFTNFTTGVVDPTFTIYPNTLYNFSLICNHPTFNPINIAINGAFVYARMGAIRTGCFTKYGQNMIPWEGCTVYGKYPLETGIVHFMPLSDTAIYSGLQWKSPASFGSSNITFIGAGACDSGFGPFSRSFPTVYYP
jgi:hypothetical protein